MHRYGRYVFAGWAIAVGTTLAPGCGGGSIESYCERACACESCSDAERTECVDIGKAFESAAEELGCSGEWQDYLDCLDEKYECSVDAEELCADALETLDACGGEADSSGAP